MPAETSNLTEPNEPQPTASGQPAKASLHRRGGGPLHPSANRRFFKHAVRLRRIGQKIPVFDNPRVTGQKNAEKKKSIFFHVCH